MDFNLTEQQRMVRQMAREFAAKEIAPFARENDQSERFPADIVKKMAPLGFFGPTLPEAYGGMGLDFISEGLILEELGRVDSSVRSVFSVQIGLVEMPILRWGTEEQKRKFLPKLASGEWLGCYALTEPGAGSDAAAIQTRATREGNEWVLRGNKLWITNGGVADLAIIFAQTDAAKRTRGMGAFLVERSMPGWSSRDIKGKLGLRASSTAELILDGVRVPEENVLGGIGQGFKVAMSALDDGRFSVAAGCVGIMQGCLDASVKYVQERQAFGRKIGEFQLVQELIAEMRLDLEAARLLVWRAGWLKDQGSPGGVESSLAKWFASEAAVRAALNAIQVHGGYGYSDEYPVERFLRDAKVATLYEGTTQIQKLLVGKDTTGLNAFA